MGALEAIVKTATVILITVRTIRRLYPKIKYWVRYRLVRGFYSTVWLTLVLTVQRIDLWARHRKS